MPHASGSVRPWLPVGLLVGLSFVFLGDCWVGGKTLMLRDFFCHDQAHFAMYGRSLREGKPSLWDPFRQCGVASAAMPHHCMFYPPKLIFMLADQELACLCWWTMHFALAAVSMYGLARSLGLGVSPSVMSGTAFAFSTYLMIWLEGNTPFVGITWGPLVLLCVIRLLDVIRKRCESTEASAGFWHTLRACVTTAGPWIIALAGVWACQLLASGEFFYYTALLVGMFVAVNLLTAWDKRRTACTIALLALALVLACGLAMPQVALTAELVSLSDRDANYDPMIQQSSAHPRHWLILFLPFVYGRPGYPNATWAPDVYEVAIGHCHLGVLPLLLLPFAFGWVKRAVHVDRRSATVCVLVGAGLFGLAMAAGKFTPLYMLLHSHLPGLGHFRFATKFYLYVTYSVALLSGCGLHYITSTERNDRYVFAVFRIWCGVASVVGACAVGVWGSDWFVGILAGRATGLNVDQIEAIRADYARSTVFFVIGLLLLGGLVFRARWASWLQWAVPITAFINLALVSREIQHTALPGLYERRPTIVARELGEGVQYRFLSNYWSASQWIYGDPREDTFDWARNTGASQHLLLEGKRSLNPGLLPTRRFITFFGAMMSSPELIGRRLADMAGLRFVITGAPFPDILWGSARRDVQVVERSTWLPRAYGVRQWQQMPDEETALRAILEDSFDPRARAVVEPLLGAVLPGPENDHELVTPTGDSESFTKIIDDNDTVTMEITVPCRTLWILNDAWYPGWKVYDHGAELPLWRANYLFRGVFLEAGQHSLRYVYQPPRFTVACVISLATVGLMVGLIILSRSTKAGRAIVDTGGLGEW